MSTEKMKHTEELIGMLELAASILEAPTNRFGKPEFYVPEAQAVRERVRELAVSLKIEGGSKSVPDQAAKVIRAFLAKVATE